MRSWYFSETAYPQLPDEDTYDSIRVTLPTEYMDPDKAADNWHSYIDLWKTAESYGLGLMINEHHSTATCADPAAPIIAGILARVTTTAPILILGNPIANRPDPVRVAEEMALIDVISRGRLEVGFVRGVPYEVAATNTYPIGMTERLWEAHDLIVKAWTKRDGPFSWTGKFFEHREVNIWPRPYREPHPPVWVTTLNPASCGPIAERDYTLATFLMGRDGTKPIFDAYRKRREEMGEQTDPEKLAYCALVYIGETKEEADAGADKIMWYATANKVSPQFGAPVGYMPAKARVPALAETGPDMNSLSRLSREKMIEEGIMFTGTPDEVYEQIRSFNDHVGGFGQLLIMGQAGFLTPEETSNSLRLYSEEVMPRLNEMTAAASAAS